MTQTITGLFDRYDDARRAVQDLEAAGVAHRDISIVGHDKGEQVGTGRVGDVADPAAEDASKGAGIGATVGGVGGLLAGLGLLAIPGIGPVVAAGWLAATAAGAVGGGLIGAATGGLVGALTHAGVPERDAHVYLRRRYRDRTAPEHMWFGVSVEDATARSRIDHLRQAPAAVRFLSIEPLIGATGPLDLTGIHWVIVGGESGPGARPMAEEWAIEVRDECERQNVPFFFKQWGGFRPKSGGGA